jgi:hypothetical protein
LYLEQSVNTQIEALIKLIDEQHTSSSTHYLPVDFSRLAKFFAFDVITGIAFGEPVGLLSKEHTKGYCYTSYQVMTVFDWLKLFPYVSKISRWSGIRNTAMPSASDTTGIGAIMG